MTAEVALAIIAGIIAGTLAAIACYLIGGWIIDRAERRREFHDARRETESLIAMLAGDSRPADVLTFRAKGP